MADIEYDSAQFVNGEDVTPDEEVGVKKIKLSNVPVSGNIEIATNQTSPITMQWEKAIPEIGQIATNINFESINVVLDDAVPPRLVTEGEDENKKHYAVFGVFAEGNVMYDGVDYRAVSHDTVKIRLLIDELRNPVFSGGFEPYFTSVMTGYIDAADKLPKYSFGIKAFSIAATGTADVSVALVTPKTV